MNRGAACRRLSPFSTYLSFAFWKRIISTHRNTRRSAIFEFIFQYLWIYIKSLGTFSRQQAYSPRQFQFFVKYQLCMNTHPLFDLKSSRNDSKPVLSEWREQLFHLTVANFQQRSQVKVSEASNYRYATNTLPHYTAEKQRVPLLFVP